MIKLIFSDLDGTLLTKDKQILDKTKNAVLQSVKNGVAFSICTARAVDEAMLIFKVLGLKDAKNVYCCCFNGGVIYDVKNKKIIYQKTVNHKHAVEIFEEVKKFAKTKAKGKIGAHIHCISDKDVYKGKNKDVADFTSKPMPFY
jgi:HAD superfamily hydrolase (TIGR01484 family)